jgi:hypothetical protein
MGKRRRDDDRRVLEAFLAFHDAFQSYVKEMDEQLWKRALDYAVTFTEGVEYVDGDKRQASGSTGSTEDHTGS